MNLVINPSIVKKLIKEKYGTIGTLAKKIGVHRNSISDYLSGKKLLPHSVEKLLGALNVTRIEVFSVVNSKKELDLQESLAELIESLIRKCPDASIVLFGSRARGSGRKYSDIDLGIIKDSPLSLKEWSDLRNIVDEQTEDLPYQIDLVDLARADKDFIASVAKDAKFLGGNPSKYFKMKNQGRIQ